MKKPVLKNLIFLLFAFSLLFLCFFGLGIAKGEETDKKGEIFLPNSKIEYNKLSKVTNTCYDNGIFWVTDSSKSLYKFDTVNDTFSEFDFSTEISGNIIKVMPYYDGKLIVLIDESLYSIDFSGETPQKSLIYFDNAPLTCKNFDVSENQLFTISGNYLYYYALTGTPTKKILCEIKGNDHTLCVDKNNVFFSTDSKLYTICYVGEEIASREILDFIPSSIYSDGVYLYYVTKENYIAKMNLNDKSEKQVFLCSNQNFDLGNLGTVKSICKKGENLITSSELSTDNYAIQEFKVNDISLDFTGFAISKGNSAFNRIGIDATDIAKSGNIVAVIDSKKISVIKNDNGEKQFDYYLMSEFSFTPTYISIKQNDLFAYNEEYCVIINLSDKSISERISISEAEELGFENEWNNGIKTLKDLAKNTFTLEDGKLNGYSLTLPVELDSNYVKSFAMDFESKEIYFLIENEEVIISSTLFDNKTISEMKAEDFKTTDSNALDAQDLEIYTINSNADIYNVQIDRQSGNVTYLGYVKNLTGEFVAVYEFLSEYEGFVVLSGFDQNNREVTLLINGENIKEVENNVEDFDLTVFTSTNVDAYYLPIINYNRQFSITKNNETVRLERGLTFNAKQIVTVNGKSFYYGTCIVNGEEITCYVPKDFTTLQLSTTYLTQQFSYVSVNGTTLFDKNDKRIISIPDNSFVRIIEKGEFKSYVVYTYQNTEYLGYINNDCIIYPKNDTVKIVICLLILTTCAFVTTIYFIKKKR